MRNQKVVHKIFNTFEHNDITKIEHNSPQELNKSSS